MPRWTKWAIDATDTVGDPVWRSVRGFRRLSEAIDGRSEVEGEGSMWVAGQVHSDEHHMEVG